MKSNSDAQSKRQIIGSLTVSPRHMLKSQSLVPMNVTLFRNSLCRYSQLKFTLDSADAKFNDWGFIREMRGRFGYRDTAHRKEGPAKTESETGAMCLQANCKYCKSLQSCPTLFDPIDSSPLAFPIPGILQARTLEWVAISYQAPPSMGFSRQEYWSGAISQGMLRIGGNHQQQRERMDSSRASRRN